MKKLLFILLVMSLVNCNSGKKDEETEAGKNMPGVENVNGNIPDTTNAINLGNKTDSTAKDSTKDK